VVLKKGEAIDVHMMVEEEKMKWMNSRSVAR
jgi:hypothetical protein